MGLAGARACAPCGKHVNVFLTGCARSGTTLLARLMTAFRATITQGAEGRVEWFGDPGFATARRKGWNLVVKRSREVFAGMAPHPNVADAGADVEEAALAYQLALIRHFDVRVVDIVRDPRDVLVSVHHSDPDRYYVSPERLSRQFHQVEWLRQRAPRFVQVRYEDILREPDAEQRRLGEALGLVPESRFSEYPRFMRPERLVGDPRYLAEQERAAKGTRPLDASTIGRWRTTDPAYVERALDSYPEIGRILRARGYA